MTTSADDKMWEQSISGCVERLSLKDKKIARLEAKLRKAKSGRRGADWFWTFKYLKIKSRLEFHKALSLRSAFQARYFRGNYWDLAKDIRIEREENYSLRRCLSGNHDYAVKTVEGAIIESVTVAGVEMPRKCITCGRSEVDQDSGNVG